VVLTLSVRAMCGLGALVVLLWAPGSSFGAPSDSFHAGVESLIAEAGKTPDRARLHRLFQLHWDYLLHEFPEFATEVGAAGQNDRTRRTVFDGCCPCRTQLVRMVTRRARRG